MREIQEFLIQIEDLMFRPVFQSGVLSGSSHFGIGFRRVGSQMVRLLSSTETGSRSTTKGVNKISRELQDRISGLDIGTASPTSDNSTRTVPTPTRERLSRPLEPVVKTPLSAAQRGALETTAEDLQDVLTDALGTSAFYGLFQGAQDPTEVVYIDEIQLNRDCSHATIKWKSDESNHD